MKESNYSGSFAVVVAAVLWSLDGLLRQQLYDLPPAVVVFWEHTIGLAVLLPVLLFSRKHLQRLTGKQWIAMVAVAVLSGLFGTLFYTAALGKVQYIPFSVVVLLQQLQPIFAIGAASLLLKEKLTPRFLALAALALLAAYGVSFPNFRVNFYTGTGTTLAALLAAGAAACWGLSTALSKYSLTAVPAVQITAVRFSLTPLFALTLIPLLGQTAQLTAVSGVQWWYILAITFSTGMVALAIYYFGLKRIPASRSTILELTWPLSAAVIGLAWLGERLTLTQWASALVLLVTVFLVSRETQNSTKVATAAPSSDC